ARTAPAATPSVPPYLYDPRTPAYILETPLAGIPRTPTPPSPAHGAWTPSPASPPRPASSPSISPQTDAGLRSRPGFATSPPARGRMSPPTIGAAPRASNPGVGHLASVSSDSAPDLPRQLLTGPRLLLAAIVLLVVATVTAGGVFLLASTPPDRSSPSATV